MSGAKEHELGNPYWKAVYFGYGMTPQYEFFKTEDEALEWWDKYKTDPHKAVTSLEKVERIRDIGWDRIEREKDYGKKG